MCSARRYVDQITADGLSGLFWCCGDRDVRDAIAREFQAKKLSRVNKIRLTNRLNSHWEILVLMSHESDRLTDWSTAPCSARNDVEH
jgi:predicted GIY-YIG superfamily endonuclease